MKVSVIVMAAWVSLGLAMAQGSPPDPQTQPTPQTTPPQTQTPPQKSAQTNTTSTPQASTGNPAMMDTKTYKGTLVDMSCASRASVGNASSSEANTAKPSSEGNTANRTTPDAGSNCPVSASSSELGMKMNDGRTVRFDLVGNQRAQDSLKNDKHWSKDLSAGKPIHATVMGVLNGDKLIVSSIH